MVEHLGPAIVIAIIYILAKVFMRIGAMACARRGHCLEIESDDFPGHKFCGCCHKDLTP